MNQSKKITDGALLLALFIILMIIATLIPAFMFVMICILPIPFIIYTSKYNWQPSLIMLGAAIILSLMIATYISLPLTIVAGLGGIMIGRSIYENLTPYETWAHGTIGFVAGLLFTFLFTQFFLEINWASEIDLMLDESFQISKDIINQFGYADQIDEQLMVVEEQISNIADLIPVGITMIAIFLAFISQWISYKVINRIDQTNMKFPPFRTFKLPVALVWIYFFALLFTFFDLNPDEMLWIAVNNVLALTGFFLALQGFSFIFFFTHYKKWSIAIPIISIIITFMLPIFFLHFVRILGIIDIGFQLRKRLSHNNKGS